MAVSLHIVNSLLFVPPCARLLCLTSDSKSIIASEKTDGEVELLFIVDTDGVAVVERAGILFPITGVNVSCVSIIASMSVLVPIIVIVNQRIV